MKRRLVVAARAGRRRWLRSSVLPAVRVGGRVRFGNLRRLEPVSTSFGFDRGTPIDRYYIERFLAAHADDIHGRVLEFGDARYTRAFGGERVTRSDVLDLVPSNPNATIVADLTRADDVASDSFDCIVCTQTLQRSTTSAPPSPSSGGSSHPAARSFSLRTERARRAVTSTATPGASTGASPPTPPGCCCWKPSRPSVFSSRHSEMCSQPSARSKGLPLKSCARTSSTTTTVTSRLSSQRAQ